MKNLLKIRNIIILIIVLLSVAQFFKIDKTEEAYKAIMRKQMVRPLARPRAKENYFKRNPD